MSSDISMFLANCCLCFDTSRGCKKFCAVLNREVFSFETDGGGESEENQLQLIESNHATLHTDPSSMHNMDIVFTVFNCIGFACVGADTILSMHILL